MTGSKTVLCVISEEQYQEYEAELATLRTAGADVNVESSPELALSMVEALNPSLVIVGMEIGDMEGIEFIALLMNRHKSFDRPLVILPDKGDGMPPIIHSRGKGSAGSSVEAVDFAQIAMLLDQAELEQSEPTQPVPSEPAAAPPPSDELVPEIGAALASDASKHVHEAPAGQGAGKGRLVAIVVVAAVVVAGLAVGGYIAFSGDDGEAPAVAADPGAEAQPDVSPTPEVSPEVSPKPEASADEPAAPAAPAKQEIVLPVKFPRGEAKPTLTDSAEMDRIVALLAGSESRIEIAGHTSAEGDTVNNLQLGIQRAKAALNLLVKRGVSADRFEIVSRGERAPLASNETKEGRRKNRRVTITVQLEQ